MRKIKVIEKGKNEFREFEKTSSKIEEFCFFFLIQKCEEAMHAEPSNCLQVYYTSIKQLPSPPFQVL